MSTGACALFLVAACRPCRSIRTQRLVAPRRSCSLTLRACARMLRSRLQRLVCWDFLCERRKRNAPGFCDPRAFAFLGRSGRPTSHAERSVRDVPQTVAFAERPHAAVQAEAIAPGLDLFRVVDECVHGGRACVFDAGRGPRSRTLRPLKNSCNTVRRRIGGRCRDGCDQLARSRATTSPVSITSANSARKVARCARWICSAAITLPSASGRSKQAQASPITVVR